MTSSAPPCHCQRCYEVDEAHAEIARHHRDFLRIRAILDHCDDHTTDPTAALRQIRNIVG